MCGKASVYITLIAKKAYKSVYLINLTFDFVYMSKTINVDREVSQVTQTNLYTGEM